MRPKERILKMNATLKTVCRTALAVFVIHSGASAQTAAPPPAVEVLRVTSTADSGEGPLRWAIEKSNNATGQYRIEIVPDGLPPHTIKPLSLLPAIKGPVQIEGMAWMRGGQFVAIDGGAIVPVQGEQTCPGSTPGQYGANIRTTTLPGFALVDTTGVEISGIEIRNFCIGILMHRASHNVVRDSRITSNRGGAGVMLTGDDGKGGSTATTTIHNKILRNLFVDNGDGMELTRGAAFNLVADNIFRSTPANAEPSQGIEILLGHDNVVTRNRFEGYSDGIQINAGHRNDLSYNTFTDNTFGVSLTGNGNVIANNDFQGNAVAIAVRPSALGTNSRISRNRMSGNGVKIERCRAGGSCDPNLQRGAIVFGLPGLEHVAYVGRRGIGLSPNPATLFRICPDGAPNCQPPPNSGLAAPVLELVSSQSKKGLLVQGRVDSAPYMLHTIEIFGNSSATSSEAEFYLGETTVVTDGDGKAGFSLVIDAGSRRGNSPRSFTATATSGGGATSPLSSPVVVRNRRPSS